jgi:pyruvate/2-oxoacid:ferredoxin oxidoreductase alpha subunit
MNHDGRSVSYLQLLTLFPIPINAIRRAGEGCSKVVVVEENMQGLCASLLEPHIGRDRLARVTGLGHMITPGEIVEVAVAA